MSELKLLPCPFCGGEARLMQYGEQEYLPTCNECDCVLDYCFYTVADAIATWNRRTQPENSRQRALQTGVCPMCEDCPDGCPVEAPNDSRNKPENEPLTLEELRKMCGQMVDVPESDSWVGGSGIIADDRVYNPEDEDGYWPFEYYGEWLAYRRKPERSEK